MNAVPWSTVAVLLADIPVGRLIAIGLFLAFITVPLYVAWRRREAAALRRTVERHSHDRPEAVHDPRDETWQS